MDGYLRSFANWQEFDAFCAKALHFYLRNGLVGGGSSDTYRLTKLHASVSSPGLTSTLSRFLEEHCGGETYSHAVEGMTEDEERRSLRNYVKASHPGETFTTNQLSTGLSLVAKHYGYRLDVGLKDRPQNRFGPNKRGVNKYVITSASQPFGAMAAWAVPSELIKRMDAALIKFDIYLLHLHRKLDLARYYARQNAPPGMSKSRQQGFGNTSQKQSSRSNKNHIPAAQTAKEQQALQLINQGKLKEAELIYRELAAAGSKSTSVHGNLGVLLQIKGDVQNAILCFNAALQLQPNCPEAYYNLGNALKEQGDLDAAIAAYNTALQLKPKYPEAHNNLGNALKVQGNLDAAIAAYNTAIKLKPNNPGAHNNLGNALKEKGDLDAAIAAYNTALQLKPKYPEAHNNLGNALKVQGNLDAAIAAYNTAIKLKPNNPGAHNNLGNALKEKGDLDAAIAAYNTALQLKPKYPEAHNNLGNALKVQGNLDAAIAAYNTALQLKPNYPDAHNNLGIAFREYGDLDEALANHKKAIELQPDNSQAFYGLGRVQEIKGNIKDSKLLFHTAVELNPANTCALFQLSKSIKSDEDSRDLAKKLEKATRDGLSRQAESMLEFAFANFHHKSKNYAKAAEHLQNANTLKLSFYPSDLSEHLVDTKQTIALTSLLKEGNPSAGQGRIFIVGAPRCGSTLLESVLSTD